MLLAGAIALGAITFMLPSGPVGARRSALEALEENMGARRP